MFEKPNAAKCGIAFAECCDGAFFAVSEPEQSSSFVRGRKRVFAVRDALYLIDELHALFCPHIRRKRSGISVVRQAFEPVRDVHRPRRFEQRGKRRHIFAERVRVKSSRCAFAAETAVARYHAYRRAVETLKRVYHLKRAVNVTFIAVKIGKRGGGLDRLNIVVYVS